MPSTMVPTTSLHEWNYVERARLHDPHAPQGVIAAKWLDEDTLVEASFADAEEGDDGPPQRVLRTWRVGSTPPHRANVAAADHFLPGSTGGRRGEFSALAAGDQLVVVTYNPPHHQAGYADVWRAVAVAEADAPPTLVPLGRLEKHMELTLTLTLTLTRTLTLTLTQVPLSRLEEHTEPLYACAVGGGVIATGGDDCTVRLWSASAMLSSPSDDPPHGDHVASAEHSSHTSLQTLSMPGKVWALALHSHLLVVGGALASEDDGIDGHIRLRLFGLADLAAGRGPAVVLRTLHQLVRPGAHEWGVRSVATHGGTVVVAGGDDGVVHVWTLAEKGKADREIE